MTINKCYILLVRRETIKTLSTDTVAQAVQMNELTYLIIVQFNLKI